MCLTLINPWLDHYRVKELEAIRTYNLQLHLHRPAIQETGYALDCKEAAVAEVVQQTHHKALTHLKVDSIGNTAVVEGPGQVCQRHSRGRTMPTPMLPRAVMTRLLPDMAIPHINNDRAAIDEPELASRSAALSRIMPPDNMHFAAGGHHFF